MSRKIKEKQNQRNSIKRRKLRKGKKKGKERQKEKGTEKRQKMSIFRFILFFKLMPL